MASISLITCDLEIWIKGHSRSLETEPLNIYYTTDYYSPLIHLIFPILLNNFFLLKMHLFTLHQVLTSLYCSTDICNRIFYHFSKKGKYQKAIIKFDNNNNSNNKKLISRWDRRMLPPEPCHRCKTLPPLYSIFP